MIMNKKIFTLLAGILMLGLFAVSGNAQGRSTFLKKQDLRVGKPVRKLQAGPNKGYYYLSVDSVVGFGALNNVLDMLQLPRRDTIRSYIPDGNNGSKNLMVLFMRPDTNKNGRYSLFVDTLNVIRRSGSQDSVKAKWKGYFKDNTPKTEISASALWCVNVTDYLQGQNPTFDFTNKQYETLLEIDAYNHESWRRDSSSSLNADRNSWRMSPAHGDTSLVPGGLSGWEFSETYATVLNAGRPLVTYLDDTHDTVAVLCMPRDTAGGLNFGNLVPDSFICVKIAPATDVRAGKVDGMIYFTLREALPFALDANDFNSLSRTNPLKFSPDAASNNIFTSGLKAAHLDTSAHRRALVDVTFLQSYAAPGPTLAGSWQNPRSSDTTFVAFPDSVLDYMGYMHLKSGNNYLRVDSNFHVRNAGGDQFLKFALGTQAQMWKKLTDTTDSVSRRDSLMYGQYVWRLVYYPSGDSVYINPFKAAYRPEYDPAIWKNGADSVRSLGWVTQQYYTFAAIPDTSVLHMQTNIGANLGATSGAGRYTNTDNMITTFFPLSAGLDSNQIKTARLRDGFMVNALSTRSAAKGRAENAPLPYKYRHRLYVSIQNLASGREVTLHSNHSGFLPAGDCSINTHINFGGYYTPCLATGSDRVSIPSDLYLIRNTDGQYLHVPLYSAHDSAVWTYLDEFVHPEELPSFQWIVEKRYRNSENSPINIINREFGHRVGNKYGLAFENVQLKKDMEHFSFRTDRWRWNEEKKVNERTTTFDAAKSNMSEKNGATFIALPKKYKNDPLLGYQWINPDTSIVNLYAFNYASGIDDSRYISTAKNFDMNAYPKTDTFLYIGAKDNFDVAYFRMDTIGAENGKLNEYGYKVVSNRNQVQDLVTLKRQAYRLNFENPFKYCLGTLSVSNAAQHFYSLSSRLTAPLTNILGRPVFYLRDVYMENDGVKDFALVQVMDTVAMQSADSTQLKTYMTQTLGSQISDLMMRNLRIAGKFNPGLFVMAVDEPTLKLKFDYRGNSVTRVSTFRLKKDADPIYRRFNTELEGKVGDDSPRTMKFFRTSSMTTGKDYLFENTGALTDQKAYYKGPRNYLGLVSSNSNPNAKTSIFVDTAYVNRGTGYIKPQYLLMIRPSIVSDTLGCDDNGELTIHLPGYRRGMYLINATDSANMERTAGVDDERNTYLWNTQWERFVFTDAIHANDALYILGGADLSNLYTKVDAKGNAKALDLAKLDAVSDTTPAAPKNGKIRKIALGNNYHKDCVFSFRLVERGSPQKDFLIESETAYRGEPITNRNPMIAPCIGGWLKIQNGVPVISRSDEEKRIPEGDLFNVEMTSEDPVSNVVVPATTGVKVVAENGSVTVLNASGKRVVISNVLGQTVANTVLTSDRATVSAPKGVVLVAVEGEPVVKALVK
ncbi:hypothetical protein T229_06310 [Tannerella sp. oral taxon BU063 isolate Cell 5]|uniref:DUF6383 domain-containing protein n=2 Tax=Tannerella serpentiformis TaxID=712710 RepID=W2CCG8_9BACT|nr:hypothetical protein N425_13515 [Tannerella sp. oral taxon BU063 isolate Cell 2]ETK04929.1 hypothetical protein T229_06310 [Tannerella sp. oral taxon BU063 isolate Cell 5]